MTIEQDITTMELDQLGDEIARTFVAIDQATQKALAMLRVFDEREGWAASGNTSCRAWLSWRTGVAGSTAGERVWIARKLAGLPRIDAAFAAGELSYCKVRALTRIADSESEEVLLGDARLLTGAQLERLVASLRRAKIAAQPPEDGDETTVPARFFRQATTDDGMVRLTFQVTAEEAAAVTAALDAAPKGGDGGRCRFPGCENRIVDGHHIVHWANGGATCIDNVISACRRHHGLLHEGGATVEAAGDDRGPNPAAKRHGAEGSAACHAADFIWRDRDGQLIEPVPRRLPAPPLLTDAIDPDASCAKNDSWYPIDWQYVIEVRTDQLGWVPDSR